MLTTTIRKNGSVTALQFPDDAIVGKRMFLEALAAPAEGWLRAYAFTLTEAASALETARRAGLGRHGIVDHSCMSDRTQAAIIKGMVAEGFEWTVATSTAGADYISHEKTFCDADGNVYTGSTNWSDSAWLQTNKSLVFNSPEIAEQFVKSFKAQVAWAWEHERSFQLLASPPAWL